MQLIHPLKTPSFLFYKIAKQIATLHFMMQAAVLIVILSMAIAYLYIHSKKEKD